MRGSITGGMVLGLHELGLAGAFDAVYGSSAGALNGMWFVSGRAADGIPCWKEPAFNRGLIRRRRALLGKPIVDVTGLVEHRYERASPGLYDAVLSSPTELHVIASDVATGEAVDLCSEIVDKATLQAALRASSALPLLAGPPVELGGRRLLDAGLSAAIPFRIAIAQGATHLLVLRSRRHGEAAKAPGPRSARLMDLLLSRIDPAVAHAFLTRAEREAQDEELLARHAGNPRLTPHILSVRPAPGSPAPSRLERDLEVVGGGLEAGRKAIREIFSP